MFRQPFAGDYPITLNYHEQWLPTYDNIKTFHQGTDYGCPMGTPILASADGTVITAEELTVGYGKHVLICHHDGSGTLYAHLDKLNVRKWQTVKQGEIIGYSGTTGNSSGPHLHFEWRRKATDVTTAEDARSHLTSVLDKEPINNTTTTEKPVFKPVKEGVCEVVGDVVNARCHCDMSRVATTMQQGDIIAVGSEVTIYNGLPYRDFWCSKVNCWLRIAEHDTVDQLIENTPIPF